MPLNCEIIIDSGLRVDAPEVYADLLRHAARSECLLVEPEWQMSLRLCVDDTIAVLHEQFFSDPSPTDVITFPSGESPSDEGVYLGDVVISVQTAAEQATEAGHSTAREVAFLALHGLLHLCGYDDRTNAEREAMLRRQEALLDAWESTNGQRL